MAHYVLQPNFYIPKGKMKKYILISVLVLFLQQVGLAQTSKYYISWLKLNDKNLDFYQSAIEGESLVIKPKWEKTSSSLEARIFVLVSKKSGSYTTAVNKLLEILEREEVYAHLTVQNFAKDEEYAKRSVVFAENNNYDLIFTAGSESARFIKSYYEGGKLPVVVSITKDPVLLGLVKDYDTGSRSNIAWTSLNVPISLQMDYLKRLKPNIKNIAIMYDRNHGAVMATEVRPFKTKLEQLGLNVFDIAVGDDVPAEYTLTEKIPVAIETMKKNDPSLQNSIFWVTSSTAVFSKIDMISQLSSVVPVLGSIPNIVSEGTGSAVLAVGIDRRNNAHLASVYAIRILKKQVQPGKLKVGVVTPPDLAINFAVARKINLKIPFSIIESAAFIYDYSGRMVRNFGQEVR